MDKTQAKKVVSIIHYKKYLIIFLKNTTTLFSFWNMFDVSNIIISHNEYIRFTE